MKATLLAGIALTCALASAAWAAAPAYHIVDRIKVGDGGFDYATFDAAHNRVLMARTDYTTAIDVKSGKVSELKSAVGAHIALPLPGGNLLALLQRKGSVLLVDGVTDTAVVELPAGKNPDGGVYDSFSKLLFAANHDSGDATVIDTEAKKVVATIPIGGILEFPVSDGAGKVFVNVEDKNQIAVIDVAMKKTVAYYPLNGCEAPTGLAYVASAKLLIASCGQNGIAKVLRAADGSDVASVPIAMGADAVIYDARRNLVLIPCRAGQLEVISVADPAHIAVVQHVPTAVGSRTGTLDPNTGRVYMMSAKFAPPPPTGGRGQAMPGTFEVLVVAP